MAAQGANSEVEIFTSSNLQAAAGALLAFSIAAYWLAPGFTLGFLLGSVSVIGIQLVAIGWIVRSIPPKSGKKQKDIVGNVSSDGNAATADQRTTEAAFLEASVLEVSSLLAGMAIVGTHTFVLHSRVQACPWRTGN